jgi:uncharacterized membrane protein
MDYRAIFLLVVLSPAVAILLFDAWLVARTERAGRALRVAAVGLNLLAGVLLLLAFFVAVGD